jgi:multicomponent K+:H+ antiporter subunit E
MKRLLPLPNMSLFVAALWLVLSPDPVLSPGLGTLLLALLLGLAIPLFTKRFWPNPPRLRRPGAALRLIGRVLVDIVTANITVAAQVLGPPSRLRPAFFEVPLSLDDPFVATLLGGIISLTPGTLTIDIEMASPGQPGRLFIHGLDVPDPARTIAAIKARYETPLKEIFGC